MPRIVLLVGIEGSGKSGYAAELRRDLEPCVALSDVLRSHWNDPLTASADFPALRAALDRGDSCILDDVVWCEPTRLDDACRELRKLAPDHGLEVVYFENDPEQCARNLAARGTADPRRSVAQDLHWMRSRAARYQIPVPLPSDARRRPVYRPPAATPDRPGENLS